MTQANPGPYPEQNVELSPADIEIGAVEIKNGSSDQRATVNASGELLVKETTLDAVDFATEATVATLATEATVATLATEATVGTLALEAGGNLAAAASSVSSIDGKITACDTDAVTVAASALPAGAATEATVATLALESGGNLDTIAGDTTSLDTKVVACDTTALATEATSSSIYSELQVIAGAPWLYADPFSTLVNTSAGYVATAITATNPFTTSRFSVRALTSNSGNLYVGPDSGITPATAAVELTPGSIYDYDKYESAAYNLNDFYICALSSADGAVISGEQLVVPPV